MDRVDELLVRALGVTHRGRDVKVSVCYLGHGTPYPAPRPYFRGWWQWNKDHHEPLHLRDLRDMGFSLREMHVLLDDFVEYEPTYEQIKHAASFSMSF